MIVRLSTKGQLVIPSQIREALGLKPGMKFDVRIEGSEIIFVPLAHRSPLDKLYGKYAGADLLAALQADHVLELEGEEPLTT